LRSVLDLVFLDREIEGLDRLVDQAMCGWVTPLRKKPERVEVEEAEKVLAAGV
jgi:hypothetical protein